MRNLTFDEVDAAREAVFADESIGATFMRFGQPVPESLSEEDQAITRDEVARVIALQNEGEPFPHTFEEQPPEIQRIMQITGLWTFANEQSLSMAMFPMPMLARPLKMAMTLGMGIVLQILDNDGESQVPYTLDEVGEAYRQLQEDETPYHSLDRLGQVLLTETEREALPDEIDMANPEENCPEYLADLLKAAGLQIMAGVASNNISLPGQGEETATAFIIGALLVVQLREMRSTDTEDFEASIAKLLDSIPTTEERD